MRVLFNQHTPVPLRKYLTSHEVTQPLFRQN
jgi:hypothetical protein